MPTIVFGTKKGGAWKSLTTLNLAGAMANRGYRVCVVDTDTNETSDAFLRRRNQYNEQQSQLNRPTVPFIKSELKRPTANVGPDLVDLDKTYDYVLVDTGGYENNAFKTAVAVADIVYMPFLPCQADIEQVAPTLKVVSEIEQNMRMAYPDYEIDTRLLITGVDQYSKDLMVEAKAMVQALLPYASISGCTIGSVKKVRTVQDDGLTLSDIKHPKRAMYDLLLEEILGERDVAMVRQEEVAQDG